MAAGYEHETIATMIYSGGEVEPAAYEVRTVSLDTLRPAIIRDWRILLPTPATSSSASSPTGWCCMPAVQN